MNNDVKTTVIGSYPVDIDNKNLMNNYYTNSNLNWDGYIKSVVDDMITAGIDIVSDGQTRDPFVNIFYRKINGCRIRARPEIVNKIEYAEPITVDDQIFVKNMIPENKEVIGLLAGPFTLMSSCIDLYYKDEKELAFDFAKVLNLEAKKLQKHVNIISVDEPFFSVCMPDYAKDLIRTVTDGLSCTIRLHACGDVSNIIPNLLDLPVDILSHEFKATPTLFEEFKKYDVTKKICLGSVRSDDKKIEDIEEITVHINKAIDVFDDKICQLSPDCGLRLLPRNIAFQKLKNLVIAGEKVYG